MLRQDVIPLNEERPLRDGAMLQAELSAAARPHYRRAQNDRPEIGVLLLFEVSAAASR